MEHAALHRALGHPEHSTGVAVAEPEHLDDEHCLAQLGAEAGDGGIELDALVGEGTGRSGVAAAASRSRRWRLRMASIPALRATWNTHVENRERKRNVPSRW